MTLGRRVPSGAVQTLTIPSHGELDTGTCRAILRQASRYVPLEKLERFFLTRIPHIGSHVMGTSIAYVHP